ncbi:MAG: 7-carboxy-7-deazaguanine synthase QueE, partial [Acidobacteria bacterium]|nr:7-carboxy-7-deazaguanine synthase QueE [Acidobacteriota bacterium]
VLITGGEPLCQTAVIDFCKTLLERNFVVSIETNGTYPIDNIPKPAIKIVDVKTPGSGFDKFFIHNNLKYLDKKDCLKFVISSEKDYNWAKDFLKKNKSVKSEIHFSPVFNKISLKSLAEWILKDNLDVKLACQLHKIVWGNRRGV